MYVDLLPKKNSAQKFPAMSEASEDKTNCDWIDLKSRGSPWFIHLKIFWKKLRNKRQYFKKKHGESLDKGRDPIEKKQFQLLLQ